MNGFSSTKRIAALALGLLVLVVPFITHFAPTASARAVAADPAMEQVWARTDMPVEQGQVSRTWMWGPEPFYSTYEPYAEGVGGQHLVTYYDKARMEINNPAGDRNSQWFVTNGLLVVEMMSGRIQTGNTAYQQSSPANVVVAGDNNSPNAPTYATLANVASVGAPRRAPDRTGQQIREGLGPMGNVGSADSLSSYAKYAAYEPTLGHNIADVFWTFLNQQGVVYQNGTYQNGQIVDWLFAMGYPITEPYWINIKAGGQDRWVLMQAFQRRVLTYSPNNADGWKVEMANVGRSYFNWRYNGAQMPATVVPTVVPTATAVANKAIISISPNQGDAGQVTVTGKNYPPKSTVGIAVVNAANNYARAVATVTSGSDGAFKVSFSMPADTVRLGQVDIVAFVSNTPYTATQTYKFQFNPRINVAGPNEVVSGGEFRLTGSGFSGATNLSIGLVFGSDVFWMGNARTDSGGSFDTTVDVGIHAAGSQFKVVAVADGGMKATYQNTMTVLARPILGVTPASGPANANVLVQGAQWPANRAINIGLRYANLQQEEWTPVVAQSDANGNFSVNVFIGPAYANSAVRVIALDQISGVRIEAPYQASALPAAPSIVVNPSTLVAGQMASVSGQNWPANTALSVGIGHTTVEAWVVGTTTDGAGNFSTSFTLDARWANAGQLNLYAVAVGGAGAVTPVWVGSGGSQHVVPAGMPLSVTTTNNGGAIQVKVKATNWQAGQQVTIRVISADNTINQPITNVTVKSDGTFQASFGAVAPWWGRSDIGVLVTGTSGQQSVRYLPQSTATKTDSNTFAVSGSNWPTSAPFEIHVRDNAGNDVRVGTMTTDANGAFSLSVTVPRTSGSNRTLVIMTPDGQYSAEFGI